jgi:1,4-alpha-glucan branching enzyme
VTLISFEKMKAKQATRAHDLSNDFLRIMEGRHHDPLGVLGLKKSGQNATLTLFKPSAEKLDVRAGEKWLPLPRTESSDFFTLSLPANELPDHPLIREQNKTGSTFCYHDAYSFLPDRAEHSHDQFNQRDCWTAHEFLGSHVTVIDGIKGTRFCVWAPDAERVSVVGNFNHWDGRACPMQNLGHSGLWWLFLPGVGSHDFYKYEIRNRQNGSISVKSDPYARAYEYRPANASRIVAESGYQWQDQRWLQNRSHHADQWLSSALSIYEVHAGSWRRQDGGHFLGYAELAGQLIPYVKDCGFTHIQLMPVMEHPYDGSWGYQTTGYFAPTCRHGSIDDFKYFVDQCHQNNIGVILDWVPAHFPKDEHGLAQFDGTALYEHEDPQKGEHRDWGTLIFNYGRQEVRNFLLSSAHFWLHEFHIDGFRVDAVASMLYLDYSRKAGEWTPNIHGGNENLEAVDFIKHLNTLLHQLHPGCVVIAEESTSWPQVSRPVYLGGLGFSMKWNMGWMNDILAYFQHDAIHRSYHHNHLTFGLLYAFSENFILPLSHDEVVHGKKSILNKMPGDRWQKFANVRLLYTYLFAHPGKKHLFMGNEFAQSNEWNFDQSLDWHLLQYEEHQGVRKLVRDLNQLYRHDPCLHYFDFDERGFEWIDCNDHNQSVISFLRKCYNDFVLVVLNFTPVPRHHYRVAVPRDGIYREIFNSDSTFYGGSDVSNGSHIAAKQAYGKKQPYYLDLMLPPLGALIIKLHSHELMP